MFLGGVPVKGDNDKYEMMGFDKNPLNPFTSTTPPPAGQSWPHGDNRVPPFDFKGGRVVATANPTVKGGPLVSYTDIYGGFYAYFSGYSGSGYDPDDVNLMEETEDLTKDWIYGAFQANNAATPTGSAGFLSSPAPNPYTSDWPVPVNSDGSLNPGDIRPRIYFNKSTYQIISSGKDNLFGIGGRWDEKAAVTLPYPLKANFTVTGYGYSLGIRVREKDNLTNFVSGDLD